MSYTVCNSDLNLMDFFYPHPFLLCFIQTSTKIGSCELLRSIFSGFVKHCTGTLNVLVSRLLNIEIARLQMTDISTYTATTLQFNTFSNSLRKSYSLSFQKFRKTH